MPLSTARHIDDPDFRHALAVGRSKVLTFKGTNVRSHEAFRVRHFDRTNVLAHELMNGRGIGVSKV